MEQTQEHMHEDVDSMVLLVIIYSYYKILHSGRLS
jgi:hypothetical protein